MRYANEMVISRQIRFLQLLWLIYLRNKVKKLDFQDRLGILLEMRLSGVAEQNYTVSYGKSQLIWEMSDYGCYRANAGIHLKKIVILLLGLRPWECYNVK